MKKTAARLSLVVLLLLIAAGAGVAQNRAYKALDGKVLGNDNVPLSGAIVYLEDTKTSNIRSFISTEDGSFRFGQVAPDIDYQVWAEYKGVKSSTKPISSFDSRKQVTIELKIKTGK